uniref:Large ribosomal subunit protein mL43 n=1 Tax=Scapholeberis mucronata TaxID=202097 RepID=A0A4Y7NMY0_9CRUS|nr:EOG090X0FS9 [Scapholeberis mucronata]SVE93944.1 EOG090X0FS9 [Scapholeberis mucronata]
MSNSHLFLKSGFIQTPLQNGLGRYIPQLQRVTLKFCKNKGGSRGMRDFIETDLMDFAKSNPGTVVYLKPKRHHAPVMVAEYLNGEREYLSCHQFSRDEIQKWLTYLCTRSGIPVMRFRKYQHTDYPTIQGVWNPFTHQAPEANTSEFPNAILSRPAHEAPTASEQLVEIFKRTKISDETKETEK